jgi:hypothetical protein
MERASYMSTTRERRIAVAHHEAGHAIAAKLRGASSVTATIVPDDELDGMTRVLVESWDRDFVIFGGVYGEARHGWEIDAQDAEAYADHGDYIADRIDFVHPELDVDAELAGVWISELDREWPAIVELAERLLVEETVAVEATS